MIAVGRDTDIRTGSRPIKSTVAKCVLGGEFTEGEVTYPYDVEALLNGVTVWTATNLLGDFGSTPTPPADCTLGSGADDCITSYYSGVTMFEPLDAPLSGPRLIPVDTLRNCPTWEPSEALIDRVFMTASGYDTLTITDAVVTLPRASTPCPGDVDGSGIVDGADLGVLLGSWGASGPSDLDGSGVVDGADLGLMLGSWGSCM